MAQAQIFRRYSAALKVAGDMDIIEVRLHSESIYIVPGKNYHDACEELSVLTVVPGRKGRDRAGYISPRHLKRLGNGNWAKSRAELEAAKEG